TSTLWTTGCSGTSASAEAKSTVSSAPGASTGAIATDRAGCEMHRLAWRPGTANRDQALVRHDDQIGREPVTRTGARIRITGERTRDDDDQDGSSEHRFGGLGARACTDTAQCSGF